MLGYEHTSSLLSAAEKGLRETTFTTNVRNWRIEDYITKHIQFFSVLADQAALGHHPDMYKKRRVDLLLDGLKKKALGGLKSIIMCHPQLYNDFNAIATHMKDVVNRMLAAKCLLWAEAGGVAMALAAVDVTDVVDVVLTTAADVEDMAMTVVDAVTASQAQPPSALRPALTKTPLNARIQTLYTVMSLATGSLLMTTRTAI